MGAFKASVIEKGEAGQSVGLTDFDEADLMDGDVTVRVTHSTVNYKDGLAMTGAAPVVRRFPMIPGIDFSGMVEARPILSSSPATRWCSTAGAWARRISAPMPRRPGSRATAGALAGRPDGRAGHGDRHRRLHRDALDACPRGPRRHPGGRPGGGHRRLGRRRLGRARFWRGRAGTCSPRPAARARPIT